MHKSEYVQENETQKILGYFEIQTDHLISTKKQKTNKPESLLIATLESKLHSRNLIKRKNALVVPPRKIFETILNIDQRTSTNGPEDKKTHNDT